MGGKAVRLIKGKKSSVKVYGDPLDYALKFASYFPRLHIIDLDGSFTGTPRNIETVKKIKEKTGSWIQMGGGFRSIESVENGVEAGVDSVIVGTAALDLDFLKLIAGRNYEVTVSIDIESSRVLINGWKESSEMNAVELFERMKNIVSRFILTDTERDGTLSGPSIAQRFWKDEEMIYAGGFSSVCDAPTLDKFGFSGVIVGKAIYEGRVNLSDLSDVDKC